MKLEPLKDQEEVILIPKIERKNIWKDLCSKLKLINQCCYTISFRKISKIKKNVICESTVKSRLKPLLEILDCNE